MTKQNLQNILNRFRTAPTAKRQRYFSAFTEKMIYRTTKTENPTTTKRLVRSVLQKLG